MCIRDRPQPGHLQMLTISRNWLSRTTRAPNLLRVLSFGNPRGQLYSKIPAAAIPSSSPIRTFPPGTLRSHRKMAPQLDGYFKQVDSLSDHFIERLRKAVAIPSISADEERRPDVV